ncbi:MAG: DUF481 domain-containing protein [Prochloraceae cyanobacterium]
MTTIGKQLIPIIVVIPGFWLSVLNSSVAAENSQQVTSRKNSQLTTVPEMVESTIAQIIPTEATDASDSGDETQESESESVLSQALEVADSIKDPQRRATVLSDVALQYATIGQISKATDILERALETAGTIEDTPTKISITSSIALKYKAIGQEEQAAELLAESTSEIEAIEDLQTQASLFTEIALKYAELGRSQKAKELLARSQQAVAQAALPEATFPFKPTPLSGRLFFGARVFSGLNSENALDISLDLEQQFATDSFKIDLDFRTDFDSARSTQQRRTRYFLDAVYKHHFDETWSYVVRTVFLSDEDENINADWGFYTGPSINLMRKSSGQTLDFFLGLGVQYEDAVGKENDTNFPVIPVGLVYRDTYFDFLEFRQGLLFTFPVYEGADYRLLSRTRLEIPITQRWALTSYIDYVLRGIPPTDKPNSTLDFVTGLTYRF